MHSPRRHCGQPCWVRQVAPTSGHGIKGGVDMLPAAPANARAAAISNASAVSTASKSRSWGDSLSANQWYASPHFVRDATRWTFAL